MRDTGWFPGLGRSHGGGYGNPCQYSCLQKPIDRGAWQAADHGVAKSWTRLSNLACTHAGMDGEINTGMDGWIDRCTQSKENKKWHFGHASLMSVNGSLHPIKNYGKAQ